MGMDISADTAQGARIKIIGVGGGGGNAVQNMINSKLEGVSFVCVNTDMQALSRITGAEQLQIGVETTKGLGCGAKPEVGQQSAKENENDIEKVLADTEMVFITAGMGGGTGTGAAPVIASIAKKKGILTVGVVTKPFAWEGKQRQAAALKGIEELRNEVDSLVVIPNDRLLAIGPKKSKLLEMFQKADDVLFDAVRGITDLITKPGLINADFNDLRTVMGNKGMALMGVGRAKGNDDTDDRALQAARNAITNPLLDEISIKGCKAVLVNVTTNGDLLTEEWIAAGEFIQNEARGPNGEEPLVVPAMALDTDLEDGEIRISVVATGIEPSQGHTPASDSDKKKTEAPKPVQGPRSYDPNEILKGLGQQRQNSDFIVEEEKDSDIPAFMRKKQNG
jgi:cell division protein FtsZ